jgi:hypothetical protein
VRSRLLIHAGFAKCGSASIRTAIFQNFRKLQKDNVFVFDKDLRIARTAADLIGAPIWSRRENIPKTSRKALVIEAKKSWKRLHEMHTGNPIHVRIAAIRIQEPLVFVVETPQGTRQIFRYDRV